MFVLAILKKYKVWVAENESRINTYANHLIVIFSFSIPLSIEVRRLSIILILLLFLVRGRFSYYVGIAIKDPVVQAFTLFFFVFIFWLYGTNDYGNGKSGVHDAAFLLIPIVFSSLIDKKFTMRIYGAFFIGMFFSELVSYGIFFELIKPMIHYGNQGTPSDPTPIYHHTHYGFMLATSLVLIVQRLFMGKDSNFMRVVLLVFIASTIGNIFIIGGRSGYVLFAVYLLALMILMFRKNFFKPVVAMLVVVTIAFFLAYKTSETFKQKVEVTKNSIAEIVKNKDYDNSLGGRLAILKYSATLVEKNWLIGMGTGDQKNAVYKEIERNNKNISVFSHGLGHLHNQYLSALLQFGIIGLLVFLNIPLQLFRYKNPDNEKKVMFSLLGLGIMLFTTIDMLVLGLGMLFTVLILVSVGLRNYATTNTGFKSIDVKQSIYYIFTVAAFYVIQLLVK